MTVDQNFGSKRARSLGGLRRAARMTPEERSEGARKAAVARWAGHKKAAPGPSLEVRLAEAELVAARERVDKAIGSGAPVAKVRPLVRALNAAMAACVEAGGNPEAGKSEEQ